MSSSLPRAAARTCRPAVTGAWAWRETGTRMPARRMVHSSLLTSRYAQVYGPATSDAVQQPGRYKGEGQ